MRNHINFRYFLYSTKHGKTERIILEEAPLDELLDEINKPTKGFEKV